MRGYYAIEDHKMKYQHPTLSVIIITKNNEKTIAMCLRSVSFAHEIIVLDSGSTDATLSICQPFTNKIFKTDWPGFGPQKNRALEKATSDWVLSIDSDEWLSEKLQLEIQKMITHPSKKIFSIHRQNQYCGQWIRFGDVGKDRVVRLFKRNAAYFSDDIVHERVVTSHHVDHLRHPLLHLAYQSLNEFKRRTRWYATLSAQARLKQGKKSSRKKAWISAIWIFIRSYILRLGFLDGRMGGIIAMTFAKASYERHIQLCRLRKQVAR